MEFDEVDIVKTNNKSAALKLNNRTLKEPNEIFSQNLIGHFLCKYTVE